MKHCYHLCYFTTGLLHVGILLLGGVFNWITIKDSLKPPVADLYSQHKCTLCNKPLKATVLRDTETSSDPESVFFYLFEWASLLWNIMLLMHRLLIGLLIFISTPGKPSFLFNIRVCAAFRSEITIFNEAFLFNRQTSDLI